MGFHLEREVQHRRPAPAVDPNEGQDQLGFVPEPVTITFPGCSIAPLSNYADARAWIDEYLYKGRSSKMQTIYPPIARDLVFDQGTNEPIGEYRNSERPALLFRLPASHHLTLDGFDDPTPRRQGPGRFLINLLGYCLDTRLQFHDLWFDAPVAVEYKRPEMPPGVVEDFVPHCYGVWSAWPRGDQLLMSKTLYMLSRCSAYGWYWERFLAVGWTPFFDSFRARIS